jgi:hypothetical protein
MTNSIPLSDLESSAAAKFTDIGDKHAGRIVAIDHRQQTDPKTGQVKTFASGDPMMQWLISIEKADGDTVALYAKGGKFTAAKGTGDSMANAISAAVRTAGANSLDVGGQLAVAYTGEGEAKPGLNAPKLFTAQYQPPAPASVPVDLFTT